MLNFQSVKLDDIVSGWQPTTTLATTPDTTLETTPETASEPTPATDNGNKLFASLWACIFTLVAFKYV